MVERNGTLVVDPIESVRPLINKEMAEALRDGSFSLTVPYPPRLAASEKRSISAVLNLLN
jgi:hypothetical protein